MRAATGGHLDRDLSATVVDHALDQVKKPADRRELLELILDNEAKKAIRVLNSCPRLAESVRFHWAREEILAAVKRRVEVSQAIGKIRMASGGTRLVHSREMKVIERYSELGPDGKDLAMLLLRLGRGRLGH